MHSAQNKKFTSKQRVGGLSLSIIRLQTISYIVYMYYVASSPGRVSLKEVNWRPIAREPGDKANVHASVKYS